MSTRRLHEADSVLDGELLPPCHTSVGAQLPVIGCFNTSIHSVKQIDDLMLEVLSSLAARRNMALMPHVARCQDQRRTLHVRDQGLIQIRSRSRVTIHCALITEPAANECVGHERMVARI